jgi:hypothetical protein
VGRVAFKRRVTPLKGNHVFALPYASRVSTFRAPGWGTLAILPPCRWRNATSRKSVPFSHRSASRIFIRQPGRIPSPVVTQDGDHQPLAGAEARLSRSSTSRAGSWVTFSLSIQGRGRSPAKREGQTSTTRGWSAASVVSFNALGSLARLALARLPVPPPAARAVVTPHAPEGRPRRRALLGRRSCSGAVLPLPRYGASARRSMLRSSGRIRVGICRWADGFRRRC